MRIVELKHRVTFAYIDTEDRIHTGAFRIDKVTPSLPKVVDGVVADLGGETISYWVNW